MIEIEWNCCMERQTDKCNRIKSPETEACMHEHLIYTVMKTVLQSRKQGQISMNSSGIIGYPHLKKLDLALTQSIVSISSEF